MVRSWSLRFCHSSVCEVCLRDFQTRERLSIHLRHGNLGCRLALRTGLLSVHDEQEEALLLAGDRALRRAAAQAGVHAYALGGMVAPAGL